MAWWGMTSLEWVICLREEDVLKVMWWCNAQNKCYVFIFIKRRRGRWHSLIRSMPSTFWIFKKEKEKARYSQFPWRRPIQQHAESESHSHTHLFSFFVLPSRARANTWTHSNAESMKRAIHFVLLLFLSLLLYSYAEEAFDVRQHVSTVTMSLSPSL